MEKKIFLRLFPGGARGGVRSNKIMRKLIFAFVLAFVAVQGARLLSDKRGDLPLSTKGKWIVNAKGERVKLAVRYLRLFESITHHCCLCTDAL